MEPFDVLNWILELIRKLQWDRFGNPITTSENRNLLAATRVRGKTKLKRIWMLLLGTSSVYGAIAMNIFQKISSQKPLSFICSKFVDTNFRGRKPETQSSKVIICLQLCEICNGETEIIKYEPNVSQLNL